MHVFLDRFGWYEGIKCLVVSLDVSLLYIYCICLMNVRTTYT